MVSGVERRRARQRRARKRHKSTSNDGEKYVSAAQTTSGTTSSPSSAASASVQSAQSTHAGPPSRRPALEKRKLVANDIKTIVNRLRSDDIDDVLSLSRRRELQGVAAALEEQADDYVSYGRQYSYGVFESLNDVIGGLIGVLKDKNDEARAAEPSPQTVVAPVCATPEPMRVTELPDRIAATMAQLEKGLAAAAAEVGSLIESLKP